jgi:mRNA interferase YafQ
MRTIETTTSFRKDFKREARSQNAKTLQSEFPALVQRLSEDQPLDPRFRDHALAGEWKDHRDCHLRPDLVLIYRKPDDTTLQLVRLGSHSELGL